MFKYLIAILSTLFRIGSYLFLRVVCFLLRRIHTSNPHYSAQLPHSLLRKILPVLYVFYLSTLYLIPTSSRVGAIDNDRAQNGHATAEKKEEEGEEKVPQEAPHTVCIF